MMKYFVVAALIVLPVFAAGCSQSDVSDTSGDNAGTEESVALKMVDSKLMLYSTFPDNWVMNPGRYVFVKAPEEEGDPTQDGRKQLEGSHGVTIGTKDAAGTWQGTIIELFGVPTDKVEFYEANNWGNVTKSVSNEKWTIYYLIEDETNTDVPAFIANMELR